MQTNYCDLLLDLRFGNFHIYGEILTNMPHFGYIIENHCKTAEIDAPGSYGCLNTQRAKQSVCFKHTVNVFVSVQLNVATTSKLNLIF